MMATARNTSGVKEQKDVHQMALKGDLQQIKVKVLEDIKLLEKRDENGRRLLHWAASGGQKELVQWLIEHNADVDAVDDTRWTPLIIACSAGHEAVVKLLLSAGASVNLCTDQGRSPLLYSASRNRQSIAKMLLDELADVNLQDKLGATPLHRAVGCGHVE